MSPYTPSSFHTRNRSYAIFEFSSSYFLRFRSGGVGSRGVVSRKVRGNRLISRIYCASSTFLSGLAATRPKTEDRRYTKIVGHTHIAGQCTAVQYATSLYRSWRVIIRVYTSYTKTTQTHPRSIYLCVISVA